MITRSVRAVTTSPAGAGAVCSPSSSTPFTSMLGSLTGQADKRATVAPARRCDTMTRVRWRGAQIPILSALTLMLLALGVYHAAGVTRPDPDPARAAAPSRDPIP